MATEKLVLELNAKVDKAIKDLDDVKDSLKDTEEEGSKLSNTFATMGNAAIGVAKAATAAAAAITAIAVATAKADRTMGNLAVTAKMSKEEFKGLAFAFSQFDVDAKGAADSLNDVSERIGEFVATFNQDGKGSGAFQDFADVMKLSDEAAGEFAMTLQKMSPEDAIVKMVDAMEDAGVHGSEMSWVLKSMSNDLEYTSQLFADNGKALRDLKDGYSDMSKDLQLTKQQSEDLAELAGSFDLLTTGLGDASAMISSTIAPTLNTFFNSVIDIVPDAANAIVDFINKFRDISELSSIREIEAQIDSIEEKRVLHRSRAEMGGHAARQSKERLKELDIELLELNERLLQVKKEQEEAELALVETREGGLISGGVGGEEGDGGEDGDTVLEDRLSEYEQFLEDKENLDQEYADWFAKLQKNMARDESRELRKRERDKETTIDAGLKAATDANTALLNDNKAIGAGLIVADAAVGVMRAFKDLPYPAAVAASVSIGLAAVSQLANLNSAQRGGGSVSGAGGAVDLSPPDISSGDINSGANLVATDASGASGGAQNITLEIDGETIASIVYDNIAKLEQDGVIS